MIADLTKRFKARRQLYGGHLIWDCTTDRIAEIDGVKFADLQSSQEVRQAILTLESVDWDRLETRLEHRRVQVALNRPPVRLTPLLYTCAALFLAFLLLMMGRYKGFW